MRRIVLVGLGHAHLHVAAQAETFRRHGLDLTLIDPGTFWYSSIGSGLLGGRYERADDVIDSAAFAAARSIAHRRGRAAGLDRERRLVLMGEGEPVPYDLVSFNVGSRVVPPFPVVVGSSLGANVWAAKPIAGLLDLRERLLAAFRRGETVRWVTVGGNHSGCELTCNAAALACDHGARLEATLITQGEELIAGEPAGARRTMRRRLERYGVRLRLGERVERIEAGAVVARERLPFDHALFATGLSASPLMRDLGLDADDGLVVTESLHAPADTRVFAAGDCAAILGHDLPKVGVFGVRAAPVLARNLLARALDGPLERYRPQRIWFAAHNLGDGTGLATWGPVWWRGRTALALKDWNDRRFMRRYRPR